MESHAHDHGPIDRGVELAVAAVVDSMLPARHSRTCGYGTDARQFHERGFGFDAIGIVTGDNEYLRGGIDADAELFYQLRCSSVNELTEETAEFFGFGIEVDPSPGNRPQRVPNRVIGAL